MQDRMRTSTKSKRIERQSVEVMRHLAVTASIGINRQGNEARDQNKATHRPAGASPVMHGVCIPTRDETCKRTTSNLGIFRARYAIIQL
jgi:hypothetical protein